MSALAFILFAFLYFDRKLALAVLHDCFVICNKKSQIRRNKWVGKIILQLFLPLSCLLPTIKYRLNYVCSSCPTQNQHGLYIICLSVFDYELAHAVLIIRFYIFIFIFILVLFLKSWNIFLFQIGISSY